MPTKQTNSHSLQSNSTLSGTNTETDRRQVSTDIGRILAAARVRADMSALQLAEKVGMSTSYLSMIERGKKPLRREILKNILVHLEIPEDDLTILRRQAERGHGKQFTHAVTDENITNDVNKEELVYAFARAIADKNLHVKDELFSPHGAEIELTCSEGLIGDLKTPLKIDIKPVIVEDNEYNQENGARSSHIN